MISAENADKFGAWALAHPNGVAFVFAAIAAWGAYCTFQGGMSYAKLRNAAAFAANEGMGG